MMEETSEREYPSWDDLPPDETHEALWEKDSYELLLAKLMEQQQEAASKTQELLARQLLYTRILAGAGFVLAAAVLLFSIKLLPGLTSALNQANETLQLANEALEDFSDVASNVNTLVDSGSSALEETMQKIEQMDIEGLNKAISNLSDVVQPLADFFEKFR